MTQLIDPNRVQLLSMVKHSVSMALAVLALLFSLSVGAPQVATASVAAGNTGWYWSNPLPQGNALNVVESVGGRFWAGGASGTLAFSDDGGRSWNSVRTGLLDGIRSISPISSASVVFAGSCALRRSDDGGATVRRLPWSASDDGCAAKIRTVVFPTAFSGYLLLTNGDLYVTADGGESWRKQGIIPLTAAAGGSAVASDIHFDARGHGSAAAGGRILFSLDAGVSWTPVFDSAGVGQSYSFDFIDDDVGFAAGDHGDLLSTIDGGASWTAVSGDASTRAVTLSAIACADSQHCLSPVAGGLAVLRTGDGGAHWDASSGAVAADVDAELMPDGRGVAVGSSGAISVTQDFGASWSRIDSRLQGAFTGLRAESKRKALAFGAGGVLARTLDAGSTWQQIQTPLTARLRDAAAVGRHIVVAAASGIILTSADNGANWEVTQQATAPRASALLAWPGGRTALVGPRGVRVSTRWGANAHLVRGPVARMRLSNSDSAGRAGFVYNGHTIAVTTNRGHSWQAMRRPRGSGSTVKLDMVSQRVGFLLDSRAELFATRNGGRNWRRIETTGANDATSIAFGDARHGYISDSTGRVLATADGGATWARQYPFFDSTAASPLLLSGLSRRGAIGLVWNSDRIFSTSSGGAIGHSSKLTISPSARSVNRGAVIAVRGQLKPATGVERVAVLARIANAKGGTQWVTQNVTVSATGGFSTRWKIARPTVFIARWSGDAAHDGDAAPARIVKVRRASKR